MDFGRIFDDFSTFSFVNVNFILGKSSFWRFEAVRRVKSSFFIAASCRSRRVLQDAAIKKEFFTRRTASKSQNEVKNWSKNNKIALTRQGKALRPI